MKKKIVFREYCLTVYTDDTIDMDGFDRFFTKKIRLQVGQLLSQAGYRLINQYFRNRK